MYVTAMRAAFLARSGSVFDRIGISAGLGSALRGRAAVRPTAFAWLVSLPAARPAGKTGRLIAALVAGTGTTGWISTRGVIVAPDTVVKVVAPEFWRLTKMSLGAEGPSVAFSSKISTITLRL